MRKTIAEYMKDTLIDTDNKAVMFGDTGLLDACARKCKHTNLMTLHPMLRHSRILTACERSGLFDKLFILINGKGSGRGQHYWRSLSLKV